MAQRWFRGLDADIADAVRQVADARADSTINIRHEQRKARFAAGQDVNCTLENILCWYFFKNPT